MPLSSNTYNKPVLPRVSDTSDLASNRASVYSGKALDFDGVNDKIDSDFDFVGTQATISFYLSWDSYGTDNVEFILEGNASSNFMVHLGGGAGTNGIRFSMASAVFDNSGSILPGYNHYTLTTNNNTASLYVNGKLFRTQSVSLGTANTPYLGIGYRRNSPSFYLNGKLSDLRIFDTALTATQVAELYNNPEQILPTGVSAVNLKLWLPMMEGAGSYVYNGSAGATGAELLANRTLEEVCQKWALSDVSTIAITGGKIIWTNPSSGGAFADQYISVSTGKTYRITFDYSASDGGVVYIGDQYVSIPSGTGTFTTDITYTSGNARLRIGYGSANALTASVDNVSVKEVVPQATGTISGATWVAGVGEPVPQTALIDWNKASNMLTYSEQLDTDWSRAGTSIAVNETAAPNGFFTADKSTVSNTYVYHDSLLRSVTTVSGVEYETSIYAKKGNGINGIYFYHGNGGRIAKWNLNDGSYIGYAPSNGYTAYSSYGSESVGNGWFRFWARYTASNTSGNFTIGISPNTDNTVVQYTGDGVSYLYLWGAQYVPVSSTGVTPYVSTAATAQTSPVLLPKGLTASKDILGNAIAKPRSAGAFNLDGASWAEVQDNASVDTVIPMTIEAWVYNNTGELSASNRYMPIFDKATGSNGASGFTLRVYSTYSANGGYIGVGGVFSPFNFTDGSYQHIVAVIEPSSQKIYINGSLQNSFTNSWTVSTNSSPLRIGYASSDGEQWLYGQIASPRVYNYALTAEQVADNFNQKASTFGKNKVVGELQAYINRTVAAGATVEAHSALLNTLTELENK